MFNNLKLGMKIGGGFAVIMALFLIVILVTLFALLRADTGVMEYRGMATDTNLAGRLQANMLMVRMNVKDYLISADEKEIDEFNDYYGRMSGFLEEAKSKISDPSRKNTINQISDLVEEYQSGFNEVVSLTRQSRKIENEVLNPLRDMISGGLENILSSAYRDDDADAAFFTSQVLQTFQTSQSFVIKFMQTSDRYDYEQAVKLLSERIPDQIEELFKQLDNTNRRTTLAQVKDSVTRYAERFNNIYSLIQQRSDLVNSTLDKIGPTVAKLSEDVKLSIMSEQDQIGPALKASTENSIIYATILSVVALIGGVFAAWMITSKIVTPLKGAVNAANQIASGDLRLDINVNSKDETGQLLTAIQNTANRLREMIGTIASSSAELSSASEELAVVIEQSTRGILKQQSETDMVATAMNQMTSTVQDVAGNASQAADAANHATSEAVSGTTVVTDTIESINLLSENVKHSAVALNKVQQDVLNISSILDVIRGIADQTNLLALNAAIEAARAGEQGRGFSVVADEVRSLASRTQDSTAQIHEIIEKLQSGTQSTVEVMTLGEEAALTCVTKATEANAALISINQSINVISDMNIQIASAAEQQSTVADSINQSIFSVKHAAEENAAASEQSRSASSEIAKLAVGLNELVGQFRV